MAEEMTSGNYNDVPSADEVFTTEDADRALRKLEADARDRRHPIWDGNSPVQEDWLNYQRQLYKIKYPDDGPPVSPLHLAMAEALQGQEQQRAELASESQSIIDTLAEQYGWNHFNASDIPGGPILEHEKNLLKTLLACEEGRWDEAVEDIRKAVEQHGQVPGEVREAFQELKSLHGSGGEHEDKRPYALSLLQWLRDSGRRRLGLGPREAEGSDSDE